jgi:DNA-binding HxlR family transcriptional regulator
MVLSGDDEWSHNQLRKSLEYSGLSIREPTFTNHLKHLEEKKVITRNRTGYKTIIKVREEGLLPIIRHKEFKKIIDEYEDTIKNAKKLSTEEIYYKLERNSIDKVYKSLYIKLLNLLDPSQEAEKMILYKWINHTHDNIIDIYLNELRKRGPDNINQVLEIHLNHPKAKKD